MVDVVACSGYYFCSSGSLAQLVEQLTLNQRVVGSSPTRSTKKREGSRFSVALLFFRLGVGWARSSSRLAGKPYTVHQVLQSRRKAAYFVPEGPSNIRAAFPSLNI